MMSMISSVNWTSAFHKQIKNKLDNVTHSIWLLKIYCKANPRTLTKLMHGNTYPLRKKETVICDFAQVYVADLENK